MSHRPALEEVRPFLDAIREAPDDDAPRLIFADWLEERDQGERAEFIRAQCLAASADDDETRWAADARAWQIRREIGARLIDGPVRGSFSNRFHRGLLACVGEDDPEAWSGAPIRWIFSGPSASSHAWMWHRSARPGLITGWDTGEPAWGLDELLAPLRSAAGASVRSLRLHPTPPLLDLIRGGRAVSALRRIEDLSIRFVFDDDINGLPVACDLPRGALRDLGRTFPNLKGLALPRGVGEEDARGSVSGTGELRAELDWVDRLESLDLGDRAGAWAVLIRTGRAKGLRRLTIPFDPSLGSAPGDWAAWSRLEEVTMYSCYPDSRSSRSDLDIFGRLAAGLA